jgi:hypothetical protein
MELRERQILVAIEPTFHDIFQKLVGKTGQSLSAYTRALILDDLKAKGLLTEVTMLEVLKR